MHCVTEAHLVMGLNVKARVWKNTRFKSAPNLCTCGAANCEKIMLWAKLEKNCIAGPLISRQAIGLPQSFWTIGTCCTWAALASTLWQHLALRLTHASLKLWTQLYKSLQHIHAVHTQVDVYKIVPVNLMHPYGHLWPMITFLSNLLCPGMTAQLHHAHDFVSVKANSILKGPKLSRRAQAWRKLS